MASKINKLSSVVLARLVEPGLYSDGGGLWLQGTGSTAKSWVFRYAIRGKRHQMGLGPLHTVDLATARTKARSCRQLMLDGKDPLAEPRASSVAYAMKEAKKITFDQCATAYIDAQPWDLEEFQARESMGEHIGHVRQPHHRRAARRGY